MGNIKGIIALPADKEALRTAVRAASFAQLREIEKALLHYMEAGFRVKMRLSAVQEEIRQRTKAGRVVG